MTTSDDLLPPNATVLERAISGAGARMLNLDVQAVRRERQPANCDAQFVPFLAWERSIRRYDPGNVDWNRQRVANAFDEHSAVGSPPVQEEEIAFDTGQNVLIIEFFEEPGMAWPGFVVASEINPGDPLPDIDALMASALKRKNVRDMPHPRVLARQPAASEYVGAASGMVVSAKILPGLAPPPQIFIGAATGVIASAKILPLKAAA